MKVLASCKAYVRAKQNRASVDAGQSLEIFLALQVAGGKIQIQRKRKLARTVQREVRTGRGLLFALSTVTVVSADHPGMRRASFPL